jgi:hypothetical protein
MPIGIPFRPINSRGLRSRIFCTQDNRFAWIRWVASLPLPKCRGLALRVRPIPKRGEEMRLIPGERLCLPRPTTHHVGRFPPLPSNFSTAA